MTDEQEKQKKPLRRMGGIDQQYATIGGNAQTSERQNVETLKQQDVSTSSTQNAKEDKRVDVETPTHEKPKRSRQTVYLDSDIDRWIRHRIADTHENISEVVDTAIRLLMSQS